MNIHEYFKEYNDKYFEMKDKFIELKEAQRDFYSLSGTKFTDMPKMKRNSNFEYEDQIMRIDKLREDYNKLEKEYLVLKNHHREEINKMKNSKHRTIMTLSFLEKKNLKNIAIILNKNYGLDYSIEYLRKLKSKAVKEFEEVILFHKKSYFSTNCH